jgi:multiple sugar transport system substrate-binding protein
MTLAFDRRHALGLMAGAPAAVFAPAVARAQTVEIVAHYSMPAIFKPAQDAVLEAFHRTTPSVRVTYANPTPTYEDGAQLLLRGAATGQLPDISFQGLNRLRIFAERQIAVDLRPMLAELGDLRRLGYTEQLLDLGRAAGIQAGLAWATSNPVSYYNVDLVRRAGLNPDAFPTNWDEVIRWSAAIKRLGDGVEGMFYRWPGDDWMFSALVFGHGGRMLNANESDVGFAGPEGLAALRLLDRMVKEGGMPNYAGAADLQAFAAGRLGMMFRTTAQVVGVRESVGRNFELRTAKLPVIDPVAGRLPTGGAGGMIVTRDPAKQRAAFAFLRFCTSVEGTSIMVRNTGYVATNQLALDEPQHLAAFYAENPLFRPATEQMALMIPWTPFPGANSVRITETIVNHLSRIVERRATPEEVQRDMANDVRRLLPRV